MHHIFILNLVAFPGDMMLTVTARRDSQGNMVLFDVPHELHNGAPDYIQHILAQRKHLGVSKNV